MGTSQGQEWVLRLYVAGMTPAGERALVNLEQIADEHLAEKYQIEVIDLLEQSALAEGEKIFAVPTLVRELPHPLRKIVGDLSDTEKVLVDLDLKQGA